MTAPAPSGGPSPLRVGGLALLGVGAVAGIIGIATLATSGGGDDGSAAAPSTTISSTADPSTGATPSGATPTTAPPGTSAPGEGGVPVPSFDPTPTDGADGGNGSDGGAPGADGGAGADDGGGGGSGGDGDGGAGDDGGGGSAGPGGGADVVRMPLRVYNNSTIEGLAAEAAEDFENAGWEVTDVSGFPGLIPTSTVYYRDGAADEKTAADYLAREFGMRSEPRFENIEDASPGVIVIVTKDYQGH